MSFSEFCKQKFADKFCLLLIGDKITFAFLEKKEFAFRLRDIGNLCFWEKFSVFGNIFGKKIFLNERSTGGNLCERKVKKEDVKKRK